MGKTEDYQQSFDLAAEQLSQRNFTDVARRAGAKPTDDAQAMEFNYYSRPVRVTAQPATVEALDEGPEIPLAEQALILHYLVNADGSDVSGEWITFREVPSGEFYWSAFCKRAKDPLVGFFGSRPEFLLELAPKVGGKPTEEAAGDAAVVVWAFPKVPLLLQLWAGDDEFPPEGNVLFDRTVGGYLSTEDAALVAGLPIYKMMAMSRAK